MIARRTAAALLALLVASGLVVAPPVAREVRAATPDLTLVGDARYDVDPDHRRVRVTVDLVATNHLHDTATKRFYFDRAFLPVLPGTTAFRFSSPSGGGAVAVTRRRTDYTLLQLTFGQRIFSGTSATFQLRFDLPDPGGAATRDVRISPSLVSFPAWAYATPSTSGGTVTVSFPTGYTIDLASGNLPKPTTSAGRVVYRSGRLTSPLEFFAFFVADKPGSFAETKTSAAVNGTTAPLTIRAWPDDPAWGKRVSALFKRGLPVIGTLVGLPWERPQGLVVQEGVSRTTGGYAGLFDPKEGRVEVAYYADDFVILHEAAHAWFNGALLADRWANEAFASYYALAAAAKLDEKVTAAKLTDALRKSRIPLNAWGAVGREASATEDYAYAASLTLATELAKRAGQDGLKEVWAAAANGEAAYQPSEHPDAGAAAAASPEKASGAPDWRGLLDLLEDRTGKKYDDLWREWVVRDAEKPLLDDRRAALDEFAAVTKEADTWQLPRAIRDDLRAWHFGDTKTLLAAARDVLARRDGLARDAAAANVKLPPTLQTAFETGPSFAAATAEADAEAAAIRTLAAAEAAKPGTVGPIEQVGLVGSAPEADLAAARSSFESGDLLGSAQRASAAKASWTRAGDVGRSRVLGVAGLSLLALLALALMFSISRSRRARRRSGAPGPASPSSASMDPPGV
ncbi:MAG TPA: hypothetical protein VKA85_09800 [Candidatus Limnocylindrales bacterium]|nr:hypothetical protein [Candidatus Limnocylindrales bacterium]